MASSSSVASNAATLTVWGTGEPRREFLHVDDLASATRFIVEHELVDGIYNVGTGTDLTIRELAQCVAAVAGFRGELVFDRSKPDGTPRKLLDVSRLARMGWRAKIGLSEGIRSTYAQYAARQRVPNAASHG